jgi:ketosteroid isomerase-like protein
MTKRAIGATVTVCAALTSAGIGTIVIAQQQKTAEQQLVQLENDWCTAVLHKDAAMLGRILADDFSGGTPLGTTQTKSDAVAGVRDPTHTSTACVNSNVKVRLYGNAAVVTGLATESGTDGGAAFKDRQTLWTDTFIMKDGRWQCVANQGTRPSNQQTARVAAQQQ